VPTPNLPALPDYLKHRTRAWRKEFVDATIALLEGCRCPPSSEWSNFTHVLNEALRTASKKLSLDEVSFTRLHDKLFIRIYHGVSTDLGEAVAERLGQLVRWFCEAVAHYNIDGAVIRVHKYYDAWVFTRTQLRIPQHHDLGPGMPHILRS